MPPITMPNGDVVTFPDDMPKEQIRDLIAKKFPKETRSFGDKAMGFIPEMLGGAAVGAVTAIPKIPLGASQLVTDIYGKNEKNIGGIGRMLSPFVNDPEVRAELSNLTVGDLRGAQANSARRIEGLQDKVASNSGASAAGVAIGDIGTQAVQLAPLVPATTEFIPSVMGGATSGFASGLTQPSTELGSLEKRVNNAKDQAVVGGITGGLINILTRTPGAVKSVKKYFFGTKNPDEAINDAEKQVVKSLLKQGYTSQDLISASQQAEKAGLGETLPEFTKNPELLSAQQNLIRQPNSGADSFRDYVKDRAETTIPSKFKDYTAPLKEQGKQASKLYKYTNEANKGNVAEIQPMIDSISLKIKNTNPGDTITLTPLEKAKEILEGAVKQGGDVPSLIDARQSLNRYISTIENSAVKQKAESTLLNVLGDIDNNIIAKDTTGLYESANKLNVYGVAGKEMASKIDKAKVADPASLRNKVFGSENARAELQKKLGGKYYPKLESMISSLDNIVEAGTPKAPKLGAANTAGFERGQGTPALNKFWAVRSMANYFKNMSKLNPTELEAMSKVFSRPDVKSLVNIMDKVPEEKKGAILKEIAKRTSVLYITKESADDRN